MAGPHDEKRWPWFVPLALAVICMPFVSVFLAIMAIRAWPQAVGGEWAALSGVSSATSQPATASQQAQQAQQCPPSGAAGRFANIPYEIKGPARWDDVPARMKFDYTLGGKVRMIQQYFGVPAKATPKAKAAPAPPVKPRATPVFNQSYIQHLVDVVKSGRNVCHYKCSRMFVEAFRAYPVKGKSVLILGSMLPWAEAHCLAAEAGLITTVDYNDPHFQYPGLRFWSPQQLSDSDEQFDAAISYSSFEHDGLGRYGDPLHPFADFLRMRQVRGLLRPGGKLYMAVPVGNDTLVFNWHRIYGPIRFPKFIEGWKLLKTFGVRLQDKWRTNLNAQYHWQPLNVLEVDQSWVPTPITI